MTECMCDCLPNVGAICLVCHESALAAAEAERDEAVREVARLRGCLARAPHIHMVAFEDGAHERLSRAAGDAEAENARLREALEKCRGCAVALDHGGMHPVDRHKATVIVRLVDATLDGKEKADG